MGSHAWARQAVDPLGKASPRSHSQGSLLAKGSYCVGAAVETVAYLLWLAYNFPKIGSVLFWTVVRLENPPKVLTKAEVNSTIEV